MNKFKSLLFLFLAVAGTAISSCAQKEAQYTDMDVEQFARFISDKRVQLIDVRTPQEYADGHIRDAANINVLDSDFVEESEKELNKARPVAVYCRSGKRAADAANKLTDKGYSVTNLEGGILAWEEAGKPVVK